MIAEPNRFSWHVLLKVGAVIGLVIAANLVASGIAESLKFELRPSTEDLVHRTLMVSAVVYTMLLAIPFVPGVEIGLALIGMLGPPVVLLVYLCTVAGLSLSFLMGRLISPRWLTRMLAELHLLRASELLGKIAPMTRQEQLAFLVRKAPNRLVPALLRHRYLALAIALNIPGNFLIGGGGGIALIAGVSRLYSVPGFLLTIAAAVAPLPLAIFLFGTEVWAR